MPIEVIFPKVDMDMESGELTQWLHASGDYVKEGEPLFVIETDKSGMEVEALSAGTLQIIGDFSKQQVPVGQVLGYIFEDGESICEVAMPAASAQLYSSGTAAAETQTPELNGEPTIGRGANCVSEGSADNQLAGSRASPAARKMAREHAIVLSDIVGSSYRGRITKADVAVHLARLSPSASILSVSNNSISISDLADTSKDQVLPHSNMRRTIASRLSMACQSIPSYQISIDCNCESLLRIKAEITELADRAHKPTAAQRPELQTITLNDFFIKALAMSLSDHPIANSSWTDDARIVHASVDIGVAVALDEGLITPIIKDAGNKSIAQISSETKDLIARANSGMLSRSEYQGGTSTVSNLGMYGITQFSSIINPPQASIVSIGAVQKHPVVIEDALSIARLCKVTFTFDHRLIDGAVGAKLAQTYKTYLENAVSMVY